MVITYIHVGGTPRFIITGLYPPTPLPLVPNTPQADQYLRMALTIAGFVIVIILLIVPIMLFVIYSRRQRNAILGSDPVDQTSETMDKDQTTLPDRKS